MKKRVLAIAIGLAISAGSLFAQTLTEVINEFNAGVESLNGQSYETALSQFNNALALSDVVGEEANDMNKQIKDQIVGTHYRQAMTLIKRKQYDQALTYLENTMTFSAEYETKADLAQKASRYLPPLYLRQGNAERVQGNLEAAMNMFEKVLADDPTNYKAHQGKGLVHKELEEIDEMLAEFAYAKEKAAEKGDQKVIDDINSAIDGYYRVLIEEELMMMDPEDADYTFLLDICEQAIAANDKNSYAYWQAAAAKNKEVEYDAAIELAETAVAYETDPMLLSALYYELGLAYQNTVRYKDACEAYNKVTEEPFFTRAERKMMTTPDCN